MNQLPWILGAGAAAAYAWTIATRPALSSDPADDRVRVDTRNARATKKHPNVVPVVAHSRSWPRTGRRT